MLMVFMIRPNGLTFGMWFQSWILFAYKRPTLHKISFMHFSCILKRYDWTFSLGTSNSAGICVGVKHNLNVKTNKVGEIPGHLLTLDILDSHPWQLITIYAPNESAACAVFFSKMGGFVSERTMLVGDFNSITSPSDHLSGNLNGTSSCVETRIVYTWL